MKLTVSIYLLIFIVDFEAEDCEKEAGVQSMATSWTSKEELKESKTTKIEFLCLTIFYR